MLSAEEREQNRLLREAMRRAREEEKASAQLRKYEARMIKVEIHQGLQVEMVRCETLSRTRHNHDRYRAMGGK